LRNVLKSPEKTDELIGAIKQVEFTKEVMGDPDMLKNLLKLTAAVDDHVKKSLDQWMDELSQKKELLRDTTPGNWAEKALEGKAGGPKETGR
jgi:hypothetical protein